MARLLDELDEPSDAVVRGDLRGVAGDRGVLDAHGAREVGRGRLLGAALGNGAEGPRLLEEAADRKQKDAEGGRASEAPSVSTHRDVTRCSRRDPEHSKVFLL